MSAAPRTGLPHLLVGLAFGIWSVLWTFPLIARLSTHIPGEAAGDNVSFLWNLHWMRESLASPDVEFFFTRAMFHPQGIDLTLHTHTAFHALIGATLLGRLPLATAQNLLILGSLWLNALCAYALAWHETRSRSAAAVAGLAFAGSPFASGHLLGHFNLVAAYGIPLSALLVVRTLQGGRFGWACATGLALVMTAYTDYYHALFATLLAALLYGLHLGRPALVAAPPGRGTRRLRRSILALLAAVALLAAAVTVTGGFAFRLGAVAVSARDTFNLRTIAGLLCLLLLATRWRVRFGTPHAQPGIGRLARTGGLSALILLLGVSPLLWRGFRLWQSGDYVSQAYVWRNAPAGLDMAALALPHARNPFVGDWVRRLYDRWGIEPVETTTIGLVPTLLLAFAWQRRGQGASGARWWVVGAFFLVWSLGPYLRLAGANTGLLSPQAALRYVPLVANARIPGRASVVATLATAVLIAGAVASVRDPRRRRLLALLVGALVALEYLAVPLPTYELPTRRIDVELGRIAGGALLLVPLGIHDGFGVRGALDPEAVYSQAVHRRPMLGGAASRVPRSVDAGYESLALVGTLLQMSGGRPLDASRVERDRSLGEATLARLDVTHVVVNRLLASEDTLRYLAANLQLRLLLREGERELYAIEASGRR